MLAAHVEFHRVCVKRTTVHVFRVLRRALACILSVLHTLSQQVSMTGVCPAVLGQ